jgi:Predicted nucleotide-binding protein containing TIR-like domain/Nucleoside 2-deoxyribosyltransferase
MGIVDQNRAGSGKCLLLLPFDAGARRLADTVRRVLRENGIEPISLESELEAGALWVDQVVALLRTCDFVIADLSRKNPNVLFELGVAHGLGKPFIMLLSAEAGAADLPSDLMGYQYLTYDPSDFGPLAVRLGRTVQSASRTARSR